MKPKEAFDTLVKSIAVYDEDIGLTKNELWSLGLQPWAKEEKTGKMLWLFPLSFYEHIPAGFPLVDINFKRREFMPNVTDKDARFSLLSYGILGRLKE